MTKGHFGMFGVDCEELVEEDESVHCIQFYICWVGWLRTGHLKCTQSTMKSLLKDTFQERVSSHLVVGSGRLRIGHFGMFPVNYIELVEGYDSGETLLYICWLDRSG